ncbi:MAG TPA: (2Fe-2S)-binding protein [Sporichthyaceae bacterium]|nr:(2Fe-2S)-binding protein [Sporichthyaceae bacterium]
MVDVPDVLDGLARAGPFFALDLDPPPGASSPDGPSWHRFTELTEQPEVLARRVAAVRAAIAERAGLEAAEIDARAAASLAHLGLTSRLISPVLGGVVLAGVLLEVDGAALWWRDVLGPVPLAQPGLTARPVDRADAAGLAEALTGGPAAALVDSFAGHGVSRRVLWGNHASATAGALSMLRQIAPGGPGAVQALGTALFAQPTMTEAGRYEPAGFRRNSCCLYYRVPGAGLCGDCVLNARPVRTPAAPRAPRASR